MKPRKIILFSPRPQKQGHYPCVPLSLLAISRLLQKQELEIKIVDSCMYEDYVSEVLRNCGEALCMGITCMTGFQIEDGLKVAQLVKKKYPNLPLVWGGWHPSILPEETIMSPYVDFVVRGQGERTFEELVRSLKDGLSNSFIPGLTYKRDGEPISCPDRDFEDINSFPSLPYHMVKLEKYVVKTDLGSRTTHYFSSQGCPNRCAFCSEPLINERRWSGLNAARVVDDIEWLARNHAINGIILVDSNFFVNKERVRQICKGLIDRNLKIKWGGANGVIRDLVRFDDELWDLLKESGCKSILVGAESGLQEILDLIGKGAMVDDTVQIAEICDRYGICVQFSLMLGFPGKNIAEEFHSILDLITRIMAKSSRHNFLLFIYTPYPGSPLSALSTRYGFQPPRTFEGWSHFELSASNTPWVAKKYVRLVSMFMDYFFFFFGSGYTFHIDSISNRFLRGIVRRVYNTFDSIVRLRWKYRIFIFPADYFIFRYVAWPIANRYLKTKSPKRESS